MRDIEVDATLAAVEVPARILNEIASHAREALPEECCGLVSGSEAARYRRVHRCRNDMTRMHQNVRVR
jgi:proteasome lid subunit RPN8/RPN11